MPTLSQNRAVRVPSCSSSIEATGDRFVPGSLAGLRTLLQKNENVKLYAISIDLPEISKEFAAKLAADGLGEISVPLLSDSDHRQIDSYGLRDAAYDGGKFADIPHATVYVIDKKGIVRWAKVESNYRERPSNYEIRTALGAVR